MEKIFCELDTYVIQQTVQNVAFQLTKEGKTPIDVAQGVFDSYKKITELLIAMDSI